MVDPKLLEQFKNDTQQVMRLLTEYATTWGNMAINEESQLSPEQRTEIEKMFNEFDDALNEIKIKS
jgi:hypothetical protein